MRFTGSTAPAGLRHLNRFRPIHSKLTVEKSDMRTIHTTRFGDIQVDEHQIVVFPEGLLGFADYKHYIMIQHAEGSAFFWMQSADHSDLAFVVVDPLLIRKDYLQALNHQDQQMLAEFAVQDMQLCALVTVPADDVQGMTVNLLGPLVIDTRTRLGHQVILSSPGYGCRHAVMPEGQV